MCFQLTADDRPSSRSLKFDIKYFETMTDAMLVSMEVE